MQQHQLAQNPEERKQDCWSRAFLCAATYLGSTRRADVEPGERLGEFNEKQRTELERWAVFFYESTMNFSN